VATTASRLLLLLGTRAASPASPSPSRRAGARSVGIDEPLAGHVRILRSAAPARRRRRSRAGPRRAARRGCCAPTEPLPAALAVPVAPIRTFRAARRGVAWGARAVGSEEARDRPDPAFAPARRPRRARATGGTPRAPAPRSCSRRGCFSRGRACRRDRGAVARVASGSRVLRAGLAAAIAPICARRAVRRAVARAVGIEEPRAGCVRSRARRAGTAPSSFSGRTTAPGAPRLPVACSCSPSRLLLGERAPPPALPCPSRPLAQFEPFAAGTRVRACRRDRGARAHGAPGSAFCAPARLRRPRRGRRAHAQNTSRIASWASRPFGRRDRMGACRRERRTARGSRPGPASCATRAAISGVTKDPAWRRLRSFRSPVTERSYRLRRGRRARSHNSSQNPAPRFEPFVAGFAWALAPSGSRNRARACSDPVPAPSSTSCRTATRARIPRCTRAARHRARVGPRRAARRGRPSHAGARRRYRFAARSGGRARGASDARSARRRRAAGCAPRCRASSCRARTFDTILSSKPLKRV